MKTGYLDIDILRDPPKAYFWSGWPHTIMHVIHPHGRVMRIDGDSETMQMIHCAMKASSVQWYDREPKCQTCGADIRWQENVNGLGASWIHVAHLPSIEKV